MAKRAQFVVDPSRVNLIATGKVQPVTVWVENAAPGSVRPQEHDESGMPLWVVDCLDESDEEAARASVVAVTVPSPVQPVIDKFSRLTFDRAATLTAAVWIAKSGQLSIAYTGRLASGAGAKAA